MEQPSVYDHYETENGEHADGVYRVVGVSDESVTLLRVSDSDGRRVNTGKIVTVSRDEFKGFVPAENPDGNRPLAERAASVPETAYWSVRAFVRELAARPIPTAVTVFVLSVGYLGNSISLPETVSAALTVVGGLGLAYVGSGRL